MWKWIEKLSPNRPDTYNRWMREELEAARRERDALRAELGIKQQEGWQDYEAAATTINALRAELAAVKAERDAATERAAQAEAERDDLQYETPIIRELREILGLGWGESITEKCRALAQRQSVPVKVRFDVTAEDVSKLVNKSSADGNSQIETVTDVMDYLAANAVIYVPAGVPSVRDLREIGVHAYLSHDSAKRENAGCMVDPMGAAATAIRNAVLSGVAAQPAPVPPDDQVKVLAKVLWSIERTEERQVTKFDDLFDALQKRVINQARAAIAFMQAQRPEGLPTADELARISDAAYCEVHDIGGNWDKRCAEHRQGEIRAAEAILTALAPWLRTPVGWEPITLEEYTDMRNRLTRGTDWGQQIAKEYDWLRSRIRPVMECKECAGEIQARRQYQELQSRINAARAALEGE